jgi:uncharacterized protein (DUF2062 family)
MRVAWATVGSIITRVVQRMSPSDRLDGLRNIGVDKLSYRRHRTCSPQLQPATLTNTRAALAQGVAQGIFHRWIPVEPYAPDEVDDYFTRL